MRLLHHVIIRTAEGRVSLPALAVVIAFVMSCGGVDDPQVTPVPTAADAEMVTATPSGRSTPTPEPGPSPTALPPAPTPAPTLTATPTSGPRNVDVRWHDGKRFVGGTLSMPVGENLPAVLLVADGGGADRDWVSPSIPGLNGSGRLISGALVESGYATLRYDRRGTGRAAAVTAPADGENLLSDSVSEVASAISYLRSRPEIDPGRIFVVAHDEGALHVLLHVAGNAEPGIAGIALLAPGALSLRQQVIRRLGELAEGPEDEPAIGAFDAAMALFIEGILPEGDLGFSPSMQGLFDNLTHPSKLPYNTEIWNLSPVSLIAPVQPSLLMVFGQADSDVDWSLESEMWRDALGEGQDVEVTYAPQADHVLKSVPDGATDAGLSTYNVFGRTLDDDAFDALVSWLDRRSKAN